jgi:NADH-quinone oxidoreductase subunit L
VLYETLFVKPFVWLATVNRNDIIDKVYEGLASLSIALHRTFAASQSGVMRWYVLGIVFGAIVIITLGLLI